MTGESIDKKFSDYVESRIQEWAEWFSHGNWYGIGYSRRSIMHRIMTEGLIVSGSFVNFMPNNENAEELEAFVHEMWRQNKNIAWALRIHYLISGSMRCKAKESGISRPELTRNVAMARQWLAGRLSACVSSNRSNRNATS